MIETIKRKEVMPKKKTLSSLEDYLKSCPNNMELYTHFKDHSEVYEFGVKLREQAMEEEGVSRPDQLTKFKIDISYDFVRIKFLVPEPVCAGSIP